MTLSNQRRIDARDKRIENLIAYCKTKYKDKYTPQVFDIYYAGYELARRRAMKNVEL